MVVAVKGNNQRLTFADNSKRSRKNKATGDRNNCKMALRNWSGGLEKVADVIQFWEM